MQHILSVSGVDACCIVSSSIKMVSSNQQYFQPTEEDSVPAIYLTYSLPEHKHFLGVVSYGDKQDSSLKIWEAFMLTPTVNKLYSFVS